MLSPCHMLVLMQIYLLLSKNTARNKCVYIATLSWVFGAILAIIFPSRGDISYIGETYVFWAEHLSIAFLCPFVLSIRYFEPFMSGLRSMLMVRSP